MNAPSVIREICPPEGVRWHDLANVFPWIEGDEREALKADIRANGVREPVVFLDGAILDGRNRYQLARELGLPYPRREFGSLPSDGSDPRAFVISANLARRHLTTSQKASLAGRIANVSHGGSRLAGEEQGAKLRLEDQTPQVTVADAARMMGVSERVVDAARKVHSEAPPEIVRAVDEGRISVSLAAQVADLPEAAQAEVVAAPPEDVRDVAREAVKRAHVAQNSGNNEWYTPAPFVEAARAVLGGFDLDPASSEIANRTVQAARFFSAEDDGLAQEWPVGRIWMNPPYAQPLIAQFSERFALHMMRNPGSEGIVLVNNATETGWFQVLLSAASAVCFPKTRIRFLDPDGNPGAPLQGQAVIYSGPHPDVFALAFSEFGEVLRRG